MKVSYDQYYQTANLFGEPYPELIRFLADHPQKGRLLDLGCGQGRDALALARLGYAVTGVDHSQVGIEQMNQIGAAEKLNLTGLVGDLYAFDSYEEFDFVLLDSMFHFAPKDRAKEVGLIEQIVANLKKGALLLVCIQDTDHKVKTLHQAIDAQGALLRLADTSFTYLFEDRDSGHRSETPYRMVVAQK